MHYLWRRCLRSWELVLLPVQARPNALNHLETTASIPQSMTWHQKAFLIKKQLGSVAFESDMSSRSRWQSFRVVKFSSATRGLLRNLFKFLWEKLNFSIRPERRWKTFRRNSRQDAFQFGFHALAFGWVMETRVSSPWPLFEPRFETQNNLKVHKSTLAGKTSSRKWSRARKSIRIWFIQMKHRLKVHFAGDLWRCGCGGSSKRNVCLFLSFVFESKASLKPSNPLECVCFTSLKLLRKQKLNKRTCLCYRFTSGSSSLGNACGRAFPGGHSVLSLRLKQCSDSLNWLCERNKAMSHEKIFENKGWRDFTYKTISLNGECRSSVIARYIVERVI